MKPSRNDHKVASVAVLCLLSVLVTSGCGNDGDVDEPDDLTLERSACPPAGLSYSMRLVGEVEGEQVDIERRDGTLKRFSNLPFNSSDGQKEALGRFQMDFENQDQITIWFDEPIEGNADSARARIDLDLTTQLGVELSDCAPEGRFPSWVGFDNLSDMRGRFVLRLDPSRCEGIAEPTSLSGCFDAGIE